MDVYQYDPLDLGRPAIRLVRLLPGSDSELISCELFRAFLYPENDIIPFEALSYTWGSAEAPRHIILNGKLLAVTQNLHQALQQLRDEVQDRILWIDAICINQNNERERGHQVQQMGEIFKQADRVLFYLGESNPEVDTLMNTLNMMGKISLSHASRKWSSDDERWKVIWTSAVQAVLGNPSPGQITILQRGYRDLLERPWFRRVWILQEVTNARAGLVLCGSKTAKPWLLKVLPSLLDIVPDDHCQAVTDVMPGPWREASWWNKSQDLYTLLSRFGGSEATESHDVIYALRGMSSDAKHNHSLYPDYTLSEEELVRDVILFLYPLIDGDLTLLRLPVTIHELVRKLGHLGHRIYCIILNRLDSEGEIDLTELSRTQTWDSVSPAKTNGQDSPSQIRHRLLMALLQCDRTGDVKELFQFGVSRNQLRTEHLIAAAENTHGSKPLEMMLDLMDEEMKLTEDVLVSAARNKDQGDKMMELLLQQPDWQQCITQNVITTATGNSVCGHKVIEVLQKSARTYMENNGLSIAGDMVNPGHQLPLTDSTQIVAAENLG